MLLPHNQRKQRKCYPSHKRQRGVVIVVALFIVALVAAMSYVMMARLERDTRRVSLILRNTQAEFYAQGSIVWAIDQLRINWEKRKPNQLVDMTPIKSPVIDVDGYKITSTIYDMQGRFNLNNMNNADAQKDFKKLLQMVEPKLSDENSQQIIRALLDWITPGAGQNEYSKYYFELTLPYRAAHRPMLSISELRLIKGMTPALFNALQPYVTALPTSTQVNVQSAAAAVLATLSSTMNLETAKAIEALRNKTPFVSTQQFFNLDVVKNHNISSSKVTISSSYFLVETNIAIEKQHVVLYTLLERSTKDNKAQIVTLWQSKGIY